MLPCCRAIIGALLGVLLAVGGTLGSSNWAMTVAALVMAAVGGLAGAGYAEWVGARQMLVRRSELMAARKCFEAAMLREGLFEALPQVRSKARPSCRTST